MIFSRFSDFLCFFDKKIIFNHPQTIIYNIIYKIKKDAPTKAPFNQNKFFYSLGYLNEV